MLLNDLLWNQSLLRILKSNGRTAVLISCLFLIIGVLGSILIWGSIWNQVLCRILLLVKALYILVSFASTLKTWNHVEFLRDSYWLFIFSNHELVLVRTDIENEGWPFIKAVCRAKSLHSYLRYVNIFFSLLMILSLCLFDLAKKIHLLFAVYRHTMMLSHRKHLLFVGVSLVYSLQDITYDLIVSCSRVLVTATLNLEILSSGGVLDQMLIWLGYYCWRISLCMLESRSIHGGIIVLIASTLIYQVKTTWIVHGKSPIVVIVQGWVLVSIILLK